MLHAFDIDGGPIHAVQRTRAGARAADFYRSATKVFMRAFTVGFALCVLIVAQAVFAVEDQLKVTIAVPGGYDGLRSIRQREGKGRFHVLASNVSAKPLRVWKEWCSWGYYALTFKITDDTGKTWVAKKRPREWTMNGPDWWTLQPGEQIVLEVDFADHEMWEGFPHVEKWPKTVTIQAVFETALGDKSKEHEIWTGKIVSSSLKIGIYL